MNGSQNTRGYARYLAFDIHREYLLVGGQDESQEWVLRPRRVNVEHFPAWAKKNLQEGDIVVLETTTNIWETYDIVAPLVSRVLVANAAAVGEIVGARVKTEKVDIKRLLRLLFGGIVPEVWVPPAHVREPRSFISYRNRLVKMSTMIRNRLNSLLHKHNLIVPKGGLLDQGWWDGKARSVLWRKCRYGRNYRFWQRSLNKKQRWMKNLADKAPDRCGENKPCCYSNCQVWA